MYHWALGLFSSDYEQESFMLMIFIILSIVPLGSKPLFDEHE